MNKFNLRTQIIILVLTLVVVSTALTSCIFLNSWHNNPILAVILIGIILIVNVGAALFFSQKITGRLNAFFGQLQRVANGDLLEFDVDISHNDEIGNMSASFKKMVDKIRFVMKQIGYSSDLVAESSIMLNDTAKQSSQASTDVAIAIQEIADGADNQHRATNEVAEIVDQMAAEMRQVADDVNKMLTNAEKTATTAHDGSSYLSNVINQMSIIEKSTQTVGEAIYRLNDHSMEIGQIVDTISVIADQTNLLALNAAIEAARAAEHGKGFAVVADEVRKLAEQSQVATQKISEIIKQIIANNNQAVTVMNNGTKEVKTGIEIVAKAGQVFEEINTLVNDVSGQVNSISTSIHQMVDSSERVVKEVSAIREISKETAAITQTVSAASEEQAASSEEITSSSNNLSYMAKEMQNAVGVFKVDNIA